MSAGANGEVVQWQAFFTTPSPAPEDSPTTAGDGSTLVGAVNARRDRKDRIFKETFREGRAPKLRRVGHDGLKGDGRAGGLDDFEVDYQTTLAREDHGEIFLSGSARSAKGGETRRGEAGTLSMGGTGVGTKAGKSGGGKVETGDAFGDEGADGLVLFRSIFYRLNIPYASTDWSQCTTAVGSSP